MSTPQEKIEHLKQMAQRPSTPGDLLADLLECSDMSQSECARRLGVSRRRVIALIKGRRISAATARKLEQVSGVDAQLWLLMQARVEAWDAVHGSGEEVQVLGGSEDDI